MINNNNSASSFTLQDLLIATMAALRTITAALLMGALALVNPIAAAPTSVQEGTSSANISPEILQEQASHWANKFILDPSTNHTIPNPEYADNDPVTTLTKRNSFNPPSGAECRISAQHYYYLSTTCLAPNDCHNNPFDTKELRIRDHHNTNTNFAVFTNMANNQEQYFQLDGHRGWVGAAGWVFTKPYGLDWAYGRIDGQASNRSEYFTYLVSFKLSLRLKEGKLKIFTLADMMGSNYCWYAEGTEWWGDWGEASCTSWCSEFNW
jgi:hypothetical protein